MHVQVFWKNNQTVRFCLSVYEELVLKGVRNLRCLRRKRSMIEKNKAKNHCTWQAKRYDSDNHSSSSVYLAMCHTCILCNKCFGLGVVFYFIAVFYPFLKRLFFAFSHSFFYFFYFHWNFRFHLQILKHTLRVPLSIPFARNTFNWKYI